MFTGLTAFALPALMAVTALVGINQLALWLRHRSERLHLSWAVHCGLGLAWLVARYLHHNAAVEDHALFAIRLQYAIGLAMIAAVVFTVREQVMRPLGRRTAIAIVLSTLVIGAMLLVEGMAVSEPVYVRTDPLGQRWLEGAPGRLSVAYLLLLGVAIGFCQWTIFRHRSATIRVRWIAIMVALAIVSAAGLNDMLTVFGLHSVRLTEYAIVATAMAADQLMLHDHRRLLTDVEGIVGERTAALRSVTASARRAEESFRDLINASPDAVIVLRGGAIVFANSEAARFFGLTDVAALIGRDAIELVHPDHEERARAALERAAALGHPGPAQEEHYLSSGRPDRVAEVVRVSFLFEGCAAVATILHDITERQQMEEKLQFAERMAAIGTLAAGVAHEINNPMSYVLGNLEYLRELLVDKSVQPGADGQDREVEVLIAEAEDGARRVVHIVRDLKAYSRRADDDRLAPLALEEVLDTASEMALVQIRHRARLEREYAGSTMVLGNRVRLGQVFLNLVVNAVQAIPEGHDPDAHRVILRTYLDDERQPVAEVEDSGAGIDPAVRARIFDPFFTTKPVGVGTGLGLSSALGILSSLGGTIEVESVVGKGTTMRVRFPRLTSPPGPVRGAQPA